MKREDKIRILQDLVRIESVNGGEEEVALYLSDLLRTYGLKSDLQQYAPGRANLICRLKKSAGKCLVLSGHTDVVSPGDLSRWTYPPFGAVLDKGRIYGRGTADMKAGLAALLIAFLELLETGADFKGEILFLASLGEEVGMYGSKLAVQSGQLDAADGFLIAEPSGRDQVIYAHKGSLLYRVEALGKSAHSSMPDKGIDAIALLLAYIDRSKAALDKLFAGGENSRMGPSFNVNTIIRAGNQINTVAESAWLEANARTVPEAGNKAVIEKLEQVIDELNRQERGCLKLEVLQDCPAAVSRPDNALIKSILKMSGPLKVNYLSGATDASSFAALGKTFDLAIYGPARPELAHQTDEYVEVEDYLNFIDLYRAIILDYLQG